MPTFIKMPHAPCVASFDLTYDNCWVLTARDDKGHKIASHNFDQGAVAAAVLCRLHRDHEFSAEQIDDIRRACRYAAMTAVMGEVVSRLKDMDRNPEDELSLPATERERLKATIGDQYAALSAMNLTRDRLGWIASVPVAA
jgi:hypothetical protein